MAAGLFLSFHGLGRISARVTASLKSFWSMADYIANTVRCTCVCNYSVVIWLEVKCGFAVGLDWI